MPVTWASTEHLPGLGLLARYTMHGEVELRTAIPARDDDDAAMQTKRFQHQLAQHHQTDDDHGTLWSGEEHLLHPLQF